MNAELIEQVAQADDATRRAILDEVLPEAERQEFARQVVNAATTSAAQVVALLEKACGRCGIPAGPPGR